MKLSLYILLGLFPLSVWGQTQPADEVPGYPQDYFRNPLDIPIFLAGNFGECRPGHFHSGVDIKTQGVENKPVHAAADGYISRIKIEKGGFGHGLYITHPNGYTTLYAHLNDFAPAIQKYLRQKQYENKRWDVDLQLMPSQFPVKKGQLIAYSGNTGASTAPHLHFEIRDTKTEHPLNPELFGLPIVDHVAPVPTEVVFYFGNVYEDPTLTASVAVKGTTYKPVKTDNADFPINKDTITVCNALTGIGLNVNDYMDGSDNTIAFYTAKLYMDGAIEAQVTLDNIGYDETRYINAYADYKTEQTEHKWVQCFFKLPGNGLGSIFSNLNSGNGRLDFRDKKKHKINIVITDDKGNSSEVAFYVNPKGVVFNAPKNDCLPFFANKANNFSNANVAFSLDARELYDDVCFKSGSTPSPNKYSDKYRLGDAWVPVHHYFDLKINPNKPIPTALQYKVVMMYSDGKDEDGRATTAIENGWYKSAVRNFGTYWLDVDTTAPIIKSLQTSGNMGKAKQITFEVKDAMTSVRTFSGYVDGKWVCFEQHGSLFFYKFDEHCPKGKHTLIFKAADENGNERSFNFKFSR